jgi:acetyl-CoA C-acetyltransferase
MAEFDSSAPVLVGVGEASNRNAPLDWPSPCHLAGAAIKAALADCGQAAAMAEAIDCIAAIRTFEDSGLKMGTGAPDNVPQAYANHAGIAPTTFVYADVGGQSPQALVGEFAGAVTCGQYRAVVIAGAEAIGTAKRARKQSTQLNWNLPSATPFENRISDFPILSRTEIRHGIISMPLAYSLIETARRGLMGLDLGQYQTEMSRLWSAFSEKSLAREHAQFANSRDVDDLSGAADGNYRLTEIYRRWLVAQDAVDVGGALIVTTAGLARELGISPDKMIWLAASAEAAEPPISERENLSGSDAQNFAVNAVLDQAGLNAADLGPIDIYSCFPCAVFAAVDTMQVPQRALGEYTLTGGLTFFGGPGNGYSLHALAAMVQALRRDGSKPGLLTANGGVMSKQAAGIYTASQPKTPWPGTTHGYHAPSKTIGDAPQGKAKILTYTRPVANDVPGDATLLLAMENGTRALAILDAGAIGADTDILGCMVNVTAADEAAGEKRNIAALA